MLDIKTKVCLFFLGRREYAVLVQKNVRVHACRLCSTKLQYFLCLII
jgi:hypothetical protein